jgi:hypothetical protein
MNEDAPEIICDASIHNFPTKRDEPRTGPFWEDLADLNPEAVIFDGPGPQDLFDSCIIGYGSRIGGPDAVLVYDEELMIETLWGAGWDYDDAVEWLYYNTFGAWLGEGTPIILRNHADSPYELSRSLRK